MTGTSCVLISLGLSVLINLLTKTLSIQYPTLQILTVKCSVGLLLLISIRGLQDWDRFLKSSQKSGLILKGLLGFLGNIFLILSIRHVFLANVSVLSMTSAIMTALGGIWFYREAFRADLWICIGLTFLGGLLIVQPQASGWKIQTIFPIFSAFFFSGSSLLVKKLSHENHPMTLVMVLLFVMGGLSVIFSIFQWNWLMPNWEDGTKMVGVGVLYWVCQITLIQAYIQSEASYLAPFKFIRYPLSGVLGWLVIGEIPSTQACLGGMMIVLSCLYLQISNRTKFSLKNPQRPI